MANHETRSVTFWMNGEKITVPGDRCVGAGIIPGTERSMNPMPFIDVRSESDPNVTFRYINFDGGRQVVEMGPPPMIEVSKDMPKVKLS